MLLISRDVSAKSWPRANAEEFGAREVVSLTNSAVGGFFSPPQLKLVSVLLGGNQKIGNPMYRTWQELSCFPLQCHQFTSIRKTEISSYLKIEEHLSFCSHDASSVCCKVTGMDCVEPLLDAFFSSCPLLPSWCSFLFPFSKSYRGDPQSQQVAFFRNSYEVLGVHG